MISSEKREKLEKFRKDMSTAAKSLPKNWVQIILNKKKDISVKEYQRMYDTLVNFKSGRSFKASLEQPELVNEIVKLAKNYKKANL